MGGWLWGAQGVWAEGMRPLCVSMCIRSLWFTGRLVPHAGTHLMLPLLLPLVVGGEPMRVVVGVVRKAQQLRVVVGVMWRAQQLRVLMRVMCGGHSY